MDDGRSRALWLLDGVDQGRLRTELTVRWDKASGEPFPAGESWVTDGLDAVAGPFLRDIEAHPITQHPRLTHRRDAFGEPGSPWAHVQIERLRSGTLLPLSARSLDKAVRLYSDGDVRAVSVDLCVLDDRGYPGRPRLSIGWETLLHGDEFVTFFVEQRDEPGAPSRYWADLGAWLAFTRRYVDSLAPLWGAVALDGQSFRTPFESATGQFADGVLAGGLARGMSWITILDEARTELAGGLHHLRGTGAFTNIEVTANGGVWLQATEQPADYGPNQWANVHKALRQALPTSRLWGPALEHYGNEQQLVPDLGLLD